MGNRFEREGQQIGDYQLLRGLGKGGFGDVYRGEHIRDHTQAAVKVLRTQLTRSDELKEFINEARTFRLKHPHIVSLLDFGIADDDVPFLVMDYAPHGSLRDRHPKGSQLPLSTIVPYVTAIASALQYAHDHYLIHRDVKPENMLIGPHQEILLSDFGIAAVAHSSHSLISPMGAGGTLPYMAPEQIIGKPRPASDQYALGIIAYEWLCGSRPFNGTLPELIVMHQNAAPPSLSEQVPTLPIEVEQVVFKALTKDPKQRFAHILEFATALEEASKKEKTIASITPIASPEHSSHVVTFQTPHPPLPVQQLEEQVDTNASIFSETPSIIPTSTPPHAVEITPSITLPPDATVPPLSIPSAAVPSLQQRQYPFPRQKGMIDTQQHIQQTSTPRKIVPFLLALVLLIGTSVGIMYTAVKITANSVQATTTDQAQSALTKKWAYPTGFPVESSPVVGNGVVYIESADGTLYAIDAVSGSKKWAFSTGGSSSPAVVNGVVYVGSNNGTLYAIDAVSGSKKWAFSTSNAISSSPAVGNGMVYVGSTDPSNNGTLYAIDTVSGSKKWAYPTGLPIESSPAVGNGVIYVGDAYGTLYAINAASGSTEWTTYLNYSGNYTSSPVVVNGVVYVGSGDSTLYAIDAVSGSIKWDYPTGGAISSSPVVVNGVVYVGSADHNLYAIDSTLVTKKWAFNISGYTGSSPAVINGVVYVGSNNGTLYAIDAASGTKKWAFSNKDIAFSSPVVVNGIIYVGSNDHNLYAFHLPNAPEDQ